MELNIKQQGFQRIHQTTLPQNHKINPKTRKTQGKGIASPAGCSFGWWLMAGTDLF
jgi:hypothetical protein